MATLARYCSRHPDRPAIGVCVVTQRAICAECSTQYRGVNYSKEGLEQYLASRQKEKRGGGLAAAAVILIVLLSPGLAWSAYAGFAALGGLIVDVLQAEQEYEEEFGW